MERSEPSLVPEWLRNTGGGTGGGSSIHHLASSQADGPLLAQPKRNRTSKSISNSDASHSSFLDRSSSTNSRRSSISNGSSKHDKNSYSRSYSSSSRNQRNKDRDSLGIADTWDSEYSDSLTSIIAGRIQKDTLKRSQSLVSRRTSEFSPRGVSVDLKNSRFSTNSSGNGTVSVASGITGTQKVSFERDFPVLGSDERPTTPDITRIPSPGLSKGVQGLSIGIPPLIGGEGWTSALAEVPVGSSSSSSLPAPQPPPYAAAAAAAATPPACVSTCNATGASSGLNVAEGLAQASARSQSAPQQSLQTKRSDELPFMGSKRLIPMTASVPKTSVLNPSDKLKPKAAMRSIEVVSGLKNGLQQTSSLQLGSQPVRGGGARTDGSKSSSPRKLVVLKSGRENGLSSNQPSNGPSLIANGHSTAASVAASVPLKNSNNVKQVDKRLSQAQLQSRNDFFNLVRKKSTTSTCTAAISPSVVSSGEHNSDELKDLASGSVTPADNGSEVDCNGAEGYSNSESDFSEDAVFYPNEEEEAFLRRLGWEWHDDAGGEGGLTEEEINSFVQKVKTMTESDHMKWKALKICRGLQLRIMKQLASEASCSAGTSSELRTADSSL